MSSSNDNTEASQETSGFSLTKAVEDVSQFSHAQNESLKEKQRTLISLQETLALMEKKCEAAKLERASKAREILLLQGEVDDLNVQAKVLHDTSESLNREIAELEVQIRDKEEDIQLGLARFNAYRNKMEGHRRAVLNAESQAEEKKREICAQRQRREQSREHSGNENAAQTAKTEIEALRAEITKKRKIIAEKSECLKKEYETHETLTKEIEIQNKRHEAIVKRLRCQHSRAQAAHRELSDEVYHLQSQLAELKRQQPPSQSSVVSGN